MCVYATETLQIQMLALSACMKLKICCTAFAMSSAVKLDSLATCNYHIFKILDGLVPDMVSETVFENRKHSVRKRPK